VRVLQRGEEVSSIVPITEGTIHKFPLRDSERRRSWVSIIQQGNTFLEPGLGLWWRKNGLGLSFKLVEEVVSIRIRIGGWYGAP
jgi:hypothetical protein